MVNVDQRRGYTCVGIGYVKNLYSFILILLYALK